MPTTRLLSIPLALLLCACTSVPPKLSSQGEAGLSSSQALPAPIEESADRWFRQGALRAHALGAGRQSTRNVILFVGDGMSLTTVTAARILEGQMRGASGEENSLAFELFPYTALSKTYNTDSQTPDSAATMTAMVTGVKTRRGLLSVSQQASRGDCLSAQQSPLLTLIELAEQAGLGTGLVSTTRITHATPAATYGHSAERYWESDVEVPAAAAAAGCRDLARQLVEFERGDGIDVLLGGGREKFLPRSARDPEYSRRRGERGDRRDLIQQWRSRYPDGRYVWSKSQLDALAEQTPDKLLGLFEPAHMQYEHDRPSDGAGEPSLAEMTRTAIRLLSRRHNGYVLVVEGGRIDHAHHSGNAYRALTDTIAFSDAVRAARETTDESDTLILVTADHSHTLTFAGYPERGNPILGKVYGGSSEDVAVGLAVDSTGLPFTTLAYANGPGHIGASPSQSAGSKTFPHDTAPESPARGRPNLRRIDTQHPDYLQEALVPMKRESHGGDDVGVWASGPGADAVRGSIEQNVIFHLLVQAHPALRAELCRIGGCKEDGVPVVRPTAQARRE